ncbi:YhcH/YjgK/YiaL family protein [Anaerobium acetethylicum]|uniref:YhcH/YjgK/YiaL family protein n=2 Tax=Anaerobium acetethylicum TaxID=1619234 RepID=A0A1D3TPY0_9FIRM|nr:YhcH/YjgK/YiaL family protein [Anaerobium acetethylicum]
MLYDEIGNILKYRGISKNFDVAADFIAGTDLSKLPLGRTEIDGSSVFINVMEASAGDRENLRFEVHDKYMDIQIDLEGTEIIEIGLGKIEVLEPVDEGKDIGFVKAESSAVCTMGPGRFIVCMAGEPHKPGIAALDNRNLKKCVVKVAR